MWLKAIIYAIHFNSQPHKEADEDGKDKRKIIVTFQFTASQGG